MLCHILFDHEYSYRHYQLTEKYFGLQNHNFIIVGSSRWNDQVKGNYKNSLWSEHLSEPEVTDLLQRASGILVNGLFYDAQLQSFSRNPDLLDKTTWLLWGGDLYSEINRTPFVHPRFVPSPGGLKQWVHDYWENLRLSCNLGAVPWVYTTQAVERQHFLRGIQSVIGVSEEDFLFLKRNYQTSARYQYGFIPMLIDWENFRMPSLQQKGAGEAVNILVGNSATVTNRHLETFKLLEKFKNSNVRIHCPLVYGHDDYKALVIEKGREMFHDKFQSLTEYMGHNDYFQWLGQMDVAIMNHDRQQGLGNILSILLYGRKVYVPEELESYRFLISKGLKVHPVSEITTVRNLVELSTQKEEWRAENQRKVVEQFSDNAWKEVWEKIYNQYT